VENYHVLVWRAVVTLSCRVWFWWGISIRNCRALSVCCNGSN